MAFYCGEALCKASVPAPGRPAVWPVRCPSCARALYPGDVLPRLPPSTTEVRAELMTERGGLRVAVHSSEFASEPAADGDLDRLLSMVDLDPEATARARRRKRVMAIAIAVAMAVLVAVLLARR